MAMRRRNNPNPSSNETASFSALPTSEERTRLGLDVPISGGPPTRMGTGPQKARSKARVEAKRNAVFTGGSTYRK